jgi:hypothetical protein
VCLGTPDALGIDITVIFDNLELSGRTSILQCKLFVFY